MKLSKFLTVMLLVVVTCFMCACQSSDAPVLKAPEVNGILKTAVLKVGQADAIIMQTVNNTIVIDVGEKDDGDEVVEYLKDNGISNIDYLFITHFDKDHVGGFPEVMSNVTASNIIVADYEGNNDEYRTYLEEVKNKNLEITPLSEDTHYVIDDILMEVSVPKKKNYTEGDNDFSLVISVTHGENTLLFAGDAVQGRLPEVISEFGRHYDFLKIPHHGKYNEHTKRFINTIKPEYAVITDSQKNPASEKTISLLESAGTKIYSTRGGDVLMESDGKKIVIN